MVVDDEVDLEPLIRQKFRKQIRSNEYDFIFAHNGLEALAKLIEHPDIGVILSDINMPEMDGIQLSEYILSTDNTIPVVIMTGKPTIDYTIKTIKRGAVDFLVKPFNLNDMELCIERVLNQRELFIENILLKKEVEGKKRLEELKKQLQNK
ncbi:MAG TPA: transcriptional regulator, partial [Bacteroidales bacterium]|nr:transcriptional regulator [Bacteroidales bacterium]